MAYKWLQKQLSRALKLAGDNNTYQHILIALLCIIFFLNIFLIVGSSIYFMDPVFRCGGVERLVEQDQACERIGQCIVVNDFTIVAKMGLYCDQQYKRDLIKSSLAIGGLIGLLTMNIVSDFRGRKYALILSLTIAASSSTLTYLGAVIQSTALLILSTMMSGFSGFSLVIIAYIILADNCEEKLRQRSSVYVNGCMSGGLAMFFVLDRWCNRWEYILVGFMMLPLIAVTVLCYILIEQSPNYYLFQQQNKQKCIASLVNILKTNNKGYRQHQHITLIIHRLHTRLTDPQTRKHRLNPIRSLTKCKHLRTIICMSLVEAGGQLCFYGVGYSINNIGYGFGEVNLVIGVVEIVTTAVVGRFVVGLKRKRTLGVVFGVVPGVALLFAVPGVEDSAFLATLLIAVIRVLTRYFMIVMLQTQSFPLQIQSIGAGSIEAFSQLGSFIAPYLITFAINHNLSKISTIGVVMLLCLLPLIFVEETAPTFVRRDPSRVPSQPVEQRMVRSEFLDLGGWK